MEVPRIAGQQLSQHRHNGKFVDDGGKNARCDHFM